MKLKQLITFSFYAQLQGSFGVWWGSALGLLLSHEMFSSIRIGVILTSQVGYHSYFWPCCHMLGYMEMSKQSLFWKENDQESCRDNHSCVCSYVILVRSLHSLAHTRSLQSNQDWLYHFFQQLRRALMRGSRMKKSDAECLEDFVLFPFKPFVVAAWFRSSFCHSLCWFSIGIPGMLLSDFLAWSK